MVRQLRSLVVAFAAFTACLGGIGCRPSGLSTPPVEPLVHTGTVDGYKFEMHGDPEIRTEQEPDPKGAGSHPKVTCGSSWFSIRDGRLFANGKDYGKVVKRGDTIKVAADGKVFVNGDEIGAMPLVSPPPPPVGGEGNDIDGDKKPAAKTPAEEAQLLSTEEGWVSEEVTLTLTGGKKEKGKVTIRFAAEKGKPSGKVMTGVIFGDVKAEAGANDTFELVEKGGARKIKITRPDFMEVTSLPYSLDGDTLKIESGGSLNWAGAGVVFAGTRFAPNKPKK